MRTELRFMLARSKKLCQWATISTSCLRSAWRMAQRMKKTWNWGIYPNMPNRNGKLKQEEINLCTI